MLQVVAQQLPADAAQRLLHRCDLRDDLRAVAILFDHLLQAADLALDAAQPLEVRVLDFGVDRFRVPARRSLGGGGCLCASVAHDRLTPLRRRLFETTLTELNAIAALARIGLSRMPNAG